MTEDDLGRYFVKILLYSAISGFAYATGLFLAKIFLNSLTLIHMILAAKCVTLSNYLIVNYQIARATPEHKTLHTFISFGILFLLLLTVLKFVGLHDSTNSNISPYGIHVLKLIFGFLSLLTVLPLFAYFGIDLLIYYKSTDALKKKQAAEFIMFVDSVTLIPVALVLVAALVMYKILPGYENRWDEIEVFVGGTLAVIVLVSAIATKTVDFVQKNRDAKTDVEV